MRKILIANRGEIACRVIRTCRRLGIKTIAVYSEADEQALHVREADEAIAIGPAPSAQSYLSIENILTAVKKSGAEAVHPGYGFLSENSVFAERLSKEGIIFVGPSANAMRSLGDKISAKQIAAKAKVETAQSLLLEGSSGNLASFVKQLEKFAKRVGYPFLIKASAGGGGRGMREVSGASAIEAALTSAMREAASAFGDATVFAERVIRPARHIEIQLLGDSQGNVVTLGDRDCTWQRRNQKIIEEAPAIKISEVTRRKMHDAACRLGRASGYDNLGTVEFLLDSSGAFYFLEVNSRIQVEHPVTELTTGLDLVELQLRVAEGVSLKKLGVLSVVKNPKVSHAVEARVCAEIDRGDGALQISTGKITRFEIVDGHQKNSGGHEVRIDTGFEKGDAVSHNYDSLLAKVIAKAPTREKAIAILDDALSHLRIEGVSTNIALLRTLLVDKTFLAVEHAIDHFSKSTSIPRTILHTRAYCAAAYALDGMVAGEELYSSWASLRSGLGSRTFRTLNIDGVSFFADVSIHKPGRFLAILASKVTAPTETADAALNIEFRDCKRRKLAGNRTELTFVANGATSRSTVEITPDGDGCAWVWSQGVTFRVDQKESLSTSKLSLKSGDLTSPLPGRVVSVHGAIGEKILAGQPVVTIESMKMEHSIKVEADGVIKGIEVKSGDTVDAGSLLARVVYTRSR